MCHHFLMFRLRCDSEGKTSSCGADPPPDKFMNFILRLINEEYVGFLDPREQYTLAASESEMWRCSSSVGKMSGWW